MNNSSLLLLLLLLSSLDVAWCSSSLYIYVIDVNINITFWRTFILTIMNCLFSFLFNSYVLFLYRILLMKRKIVLKWIHIYMYITVYSNFHQVLIQIFLILLSEEKIIYVLFFFIAIIYFSIQFCLQ
jgi:hypothetical protein